MSEAAREPYDFDPRFEACVLFYVCSDSKFWAAAGRELEVDSFSLAPAKALCEAARQLHKEGVPPSCLGVLQRLRATVSAGKLEARLLEESDALFESVLELQPKPPSAEAVLSELIPLLKRRLQSKAVLLSHQQWASRGDFTVVAATLARAERLGRGEEQPGVQLGAAGFRAIAEVGALERLPTGVFELDQQIGGLWRGAVGFWLGRSGGGKSMALIHQTATAVLQKRRFTGFVTLELPQSLQLARLYAHLTGVPVNLILDNPAQRAESQRRMASLEPMIGICEVVELPAHGTSPQDLDHWIDSQEQKHSQKMEVLVVDYADLLTAPVPRGESNDYVMMRQVYLGLQKLAKGRNMWVWTGSQAGRGKGTKKADSEYLDLESVADSMNKSRIADMVLSLNPREEGQFEIFVAKHRLGRAGYAVGPLPSEFELARLTPWARNIFNW